MRGDGETDIGDDSWTAEREGERERGRDWNEAASRAEQTPPV